MQQKPRKTGFTKTLYILTDSDYNYIIREIQHTEK